MPIQVGIFRWQLPCPGARNKVWSVLPVGCKWAVGTAGGHCTCHLDRLELGQSRRTVVNHLDTWTLTHPPHLTMSACPPACLSSFRACACAYMPSFQGCLGACPFALTRQYYVYVCNSGRFLPSYSAVLLNLFES